MKLQKPINTKIILKRVLNKIDHFHGKDIDVDGINDIYNFEENEIIFIDTILLLKYIEFKKNVFVIASDEVFKLINKQYEKYNQLSIYVSPDPLSDLNKLITYLKLNEHIDRDKCSISTSEDSGYCINNNTIVHKTAVISKNVSIGKGTIIHPNVTIIGYVDIGQNVTIHAGSIIGKTGFFYSANRKLIPSLGKIIIHDNVDIGSNCVFDKPQFNTTEIGSNTKIDNLVHVAHDVNIGSNCLIMANSAIGGYVKIEDNVRLGGMSCIVNRIVIRKGSNIAPMSYIVNSTENDKFYIGTSPAKERSKYNKKRVDANLAKVYKKELSRYTSFLSKEYPEHFKSSPRLRLKIIISIFKNALGLKSIYLRQELTEVGADSLDLAEIINSIEERFDIEIDDKMLQQSKTIKDIVKIINKIMEDNNE